MLTIGQHSFWQCHTSLRCQQKLEQLERLRSEDTPPPPPPPPHDYPYYWLILDPKSKEDKVKVKNLKNLPKFQILKQTLHMAHLLQLLDKMCKYQMGPTNIVEDTEQTRFCPQMDRRTDRQGETSKPPLQLCWNGGIMKLTSWNLKVIVSIRVNFNKHWIINSEYPPIFPDLPRLGSPCHNSSLVRCMHSGQMKNTRNFHFSPSHWHLPTHSRQTTTK